MSEKYCGNCGGIRIGDNQFCIICGSKFSVTEVRNCPTCSQSWPEGLPFPDQQNREREDVAPPTSPISAAPQTLSVGKLSEFEVRLVSALDQLARPIKWSDTLLKGKDCLNCGCPDSASVCTVCGFSK